MKKTKESKNLKPIKDLHVETIKPDEPKKGWKQIDILVSKNDLKNIVNGKQDELFRRFSRYNACLFSVKAPNGFYDPRKDITHVRLIAGLTENRKYAICEIEGIHAFHFDGDFVPMGMKPGSKAFSIVIRQVVEHNLK